MTDVVSCTGRARNRGWRTGITVRTLALVLASQFDLLGGAGDSPPPELETKAAFVLNFIRFVHWASVPAEENADFPICVLAYSDFSSEVRRAVAGKKLGSRPISIRLDPNPNSTRCKVLLVDASEYQIARPAMNAIKDSPVLTIGNGAGLIPLGGMFELIVQDRKVKFDTSLEAIGRAKLEVSARLLELSRNLRKGGN